ncbi:TRM11 family SAM-dependent methyltransferase [Haloarcula sediminis]|uniref:TRM11 family SAM-dependent methyltransferase n=1 Tax=Haloarcula sediminis TaxID=3111777 RepID=UPI002D798451|nr:DNA methyltransferase [Haloarcula sp. CK38]
MSDESPDYKQSRLFTTDDGDFDEARAKDDALPVEDGEVVDTGELADHQRYVEYRGIYDERNRVNDLTGREWKFATKSVIPEQFPPAFQHDLRSEHGGQKPPRLCLALVQRFSKAGDLVLDPFAGVGGTLLGASLAAYEGTGHRDAIGFERNDRWIDIYETVLERENTERAARGEGPLAAQELRHGDCTDLVEDVETDAVDFLLTDVPYWDMDKVEQTRNEAATRDSKLDDFDGDDRQTKADWLDGMEAKFAQFRRVVREGGYVAVFIGDMYREQSYNMLSADLADRIEAAGYTLKANLVWYDPSKDLHVYGYPFSFVPSMVHQNILVFRNE